MGGADEPRQKIRQRLLRSAETVVASPGAGSTVEGELSTGALLVERIQSLLTNFPAKLQRVAAHLVGEAVRQVPGGVDPANWRGWTYTTVSEAGNVNFWRSKIGRVGYTGVKA